MAAAGRLAAAPKHEHSRGDGDADEAASMLILYAALDVDMDMAAMRCDDAEKLPLPPCPDEFQTLARWPLSEACCRTNFFELEHNSH